MTRCDVNDAAIEREREAVEKVSVINSSSFMMKTQ